MSETPAGWYPAPHANNELRYWNGHSWLESSPAPPAAPLGGAVQGQTGQSPTQLLTAPPSPAPGRPKGLALTALILGIVAFLVGLIPWFGLLLAIGAIGVGVFALVKNQPKGLAITGTVLGGVALIAGLIATISFSSFVGAVSSSDTAPDAPIAEAPVESEAPVVAEEEPPAEAEALVASGTAENPFPQPYVAAGLFGGEKYSLTGRIIEANANALVEEWNQFNTDAPAGFKYVVVELTMTGIDPDGVEPSLAAWDLSLATSEGNQYSNEFIVFDDGMPSMQDGPTLYPGSAFTGYTAYLVPEAAQSFLLHDNGNYIAF